MKIGLFNANGLNGKGEEVLRFHDIHNIDLFFIVETWNRTGQSPVIKNNLFNLTNTNEAYIPGASGRRSQGGILCLARPDLRNEVTILFTGETNNFIIIKVGGNILTVCYLSPSLPNDCFEVMLERTLEYAGDSPAYIFGDFNARMKDISRDTVWNSRGKALSSYLDESNLLLWNADFGRFTTFNPTNLGRGVTDIVLSNGPKPANIIIFEEESLGGSDHHPITFEIQAESLRNKCFDRWNIRKLDDPDILKTYVDELEENCEILKSAMEAENDLDNCYKLFTDYIGNAASKSCGVFKYRNYSSTEFWTDELLRLKEDLQTKLNYLQNLSRSIDISARNAFRIAYHDSARKYREAVSFRKTEVFQSYSAKLSIPKNSAALQKMISCRKNKLNRQGCKLDSEKIDEHVQHFRNTFGGDPEGVQVEDLSFDYPEQLTADFLNAFIFRENVETAIRSLPFGKAAGVDNILAEFLIFGGKSVAEALLILFKKIVLNKAIPSEWKLALIVPVYKSKGDETLISNYRPIALTCITRRVFERIILFAMDPFISKLAKTQGGFRKFRSTLDQCFILNEVMRQFPNAVHAFLDIRAAFDTINRNRLWRTLLSDYGLPIVVIHLLKSLFDFNASKLIIAGRQSVEIGNLRGLLQGSSLSPILFNFYINSLLVTLNSLQKLNLNAIYSNHLAFADDLSLHARTNQTLQELLKVCEDWSKTNGIEFQPLKCFILSDSDGRSQLEIYGTKLSKKTTVDYLGLPFNIKGADYSLNLQRRSIKARQVAHTLSKFGMNLGGFSAQASGNLYKSFIRPIIEYGMQLSILDQKAMQVASRTQNFALRLALSLHQRSSGNAVMKLMQIEPISIRNQVVLMKYCARLHNSNDKSIPAVVLWRHAYANNAKNTTPWYCRKSELNFIANFIPLFGRRWISGKHKLEEAFKDKTQVKKFIQGKISLMDNNLNNVAGVIDYQTGDPFRYILTSNSVSNEIKIPVIRWLTGTIAVHKPCLNNNCGEELSRNHAVECSGAQDFLKRKYREEFLEMERSNYRGTIIDLILNKYRSSNEHQIYKNVADGIALIYRNCLKFKQKPNGFYEPREEVDLGNPVGVGRRSATTPPTSLQRLPSQPRRPG